SILTPIVVCLLVVSPVGLAAASADDSHAVQGTWIPTKAELGAKPMADEVLKTISLKLDNDKYAVFVGDSPDRGTYTLDSTTNPKSMSVTGTDGPNKGKTFPAIYELDGDSLRICYDLAGKKRPTEFKTRAGTKLFLATYKRQKP